MSDTTPEKTIGYVFNLVTGLGDAQQLTLSGNLAMGATKEEMGLEFDKLLAVTNRLTARHKIEKKKADIAADAAMINSMQSDLKQLDDSRPVAANGAPMKLSMGEKNNRDAMMRNIRHLEGRVAGYREDLAGLLKEAE